MGRRLHANFISAGRRYNGKIPADAPAAFD